ncbi:hypothetical protein HKX48_009473 [Thoreauomyces humboldtii]|nr:hypothetical protein HKX48_009473 [Thoreauomyces humboldtii]
MEDRNVDFVIVGLGNPGEYAGSRHNAGYIFCDYLANELTKATSLALGFGTPGPPQFVRRDDLMADIHDVTFESLRILLVKPLTGMNGSGEAVAKVLAAYNITAPASQLICVCDDLNTLPGSIAIQSRAAWYHRRVYYELMRILLSPEDGGELRSLQGHRGIESIASTLTHGNWIRFRVGIGRPAEGQSIVSYVLSRFEDGQEMNLLGYALSLAVQSFQFLATKKGDIKDTKKKFASSKKLPKTLPPWLMGNFG